jgi:hypothetical protein
VDGESRTIYVPSIIYQPSSIITIYHIYRHPPSVIRHPSIWLNSRQAKVLSIEYKQFIDLVCPEFIQRGFFEYLLYFVAVAGIERDPNALGFHAYGVLIDHFLIDQVVDIGTVRGHEVHKIIVELKSYRYLEFLH